MINSALNRFYDFKGREDKGQLLENYMYKRLTNHYDKDNIKFWNCRNLNSTSKKKFVENYHGYRFQTVSYNINDECKWVLKL